MISKQELEKTASAQKEKMLRGNSYRREALSLMPQTLHEDALVISGIRRCGKSTLVGQMVRQVEEEGQRAFYLNFDTPSVYGFAFEHFKIVDSLLAENTYDCLFFDEIQVVDSWEIYVRGKLDEGYKVVVTGSNASMLSRELGTKLTGRHLTRELFPFSYTEFCGFMGMPVGEASVTSYMTMGGFPKYLAAKDEELIEEMVNDIVYRDIAVRYNLRDERTLKALLALLLGNVGNLVSPSKLKQQLGVKSITTISDYFSYFEQSYLLSFVPRFAYSIKAQMISPKKVYCVDNGIISVVSPSFTRNDGHKLENMVFAHLRRKYKEVFYYANGECECDFIVARHGVPQKAIQVCYDLNVDNTAREVKGVADAMEALGVESGFVVTMRQDDSMIVDGKTIRVVPVYEILSTNLI